MFTFNLESCSYNKIHFIGIEAGSSMSGIALLLSKKGFEISGSDRSETDYLAPLREANIKIYIGQKKRKYKGSGSVCLYRCNFTG